MEETVRMVQSAAQAGVEITAELLKIIAPALAKGGMKLLGAGGKLLGYGLDKLADAAAEGSVSRKHLFAEAAKAKSEVRSTDSFPSEAAERMAEMAKERGIPVSLNGEGASRSLSFLERDKDAVAQIMRDWQAELLAPRADRQGVKSFAVKDPHNIGVIKSEFEQNGVECWFSQKNGEIKCNFKAEDMEKAKTVSENFKKKQSEIAEKFTVSPNVPETARQAELLAQIEQLENAAPTAESYDSILAEMKNGGAEFPGFSERNTEIINREMPDAKQVAGKAFWEERGFAVNKLAKGVEITVPQKDDNGKPVLDGEGKPTFTTAVVYDISETNAYEKTVQTQIGELRKEYDAERLKAFSETENKTVTVTNEENGKSFELNIENGLRRADVADMLTENLGYSAAQAELAANKFGAELGLSDNFYADRTQAENIDRMSINIRYGSDDITLQNTAFSALKMKDGENVRLSVENDGKAVLVTPAELSDSELKSVFKEQLGMSDIQAEKAVEKSRKIDGQINAKLRETVYDRDETQRTVNIERTSQTAFVVAAGDKVKSYTFAQINLEERIANDFGIPRENARNVVRKAQNQSAIQNKIRSGSENKRRAAKLKNDPLAQNKSAGAKKVKR